MPLKEEEFNTIVVLLGFAGLFIVPTIILAILHKGPLEYFTAITLFVLIGAIFWNASMALRDD